MPEDACREGSGGRTCSHKTTRTDDDLDGDLRIAGLPVERRFPSMDARSPGCCSDPYGIYAAYRFGGLGDISRAFPGWSHACIPSRREPIYWIRRCLPEAAS